MLDGVAERQVRGERGRRGINLSQQVGGRSGGGHGLLPQGGQRSLQRERAQFAGKAPEVGARFGAGASTDRQGLIRQPDGVGGATGFDDAQNELVQHGEPEAEVLGQRRRRRLERSQQIRRGFGGGDGLRSQSGQRNLQRERAQFAGDAAYIGATCRPGTSTDGDGFVGEADGVSWATGLDRRAGRARGAR